MHIKYVKEQVAYFISEVLVNPSLSPEDTIHFSLLYDVFGP